MEQNFQSLTAVSIKLFSCILHFTYESGNLFIVSARDFSSRLFFLVIRQFCRCLCLSPAEDLFRKRRLIAPRSSSILK